MSPSEHICRLYCIDLVELAERLRLWAKDRRRIVGHPSTIRGIVEEWRVNRS